MGAGWDELMQQEIFTPLGMINSGTNIQDKKVLLLQFNTLF